MMDGRPIIAVAASAPGRCGNYVDALSRLGAVALEACGDVDPMTCDGLLLPGGGDVDPALYGREREPACEAPDRALDDRQLRALQGFVRAGKPVLGICRGHQLINVCFGGTLIQDIPQKAVHDWDDGVNEDKSHPVRAAAGTFPAALHGERFSVNSAHHQAVDRLGGELVAAAWSDDGVLEAFFHRTLPVYGVQWHPERMCFARARRDTVDGAKLIGWFVELCAGRRKGV